MKTNKVVSIVIATFVLVFGVSLLQSIQLNYSCYPLWTAHRYGDIKEVFYVCVDGTSFTRNETSNSKIIDDLINNEINKEVGKEVVLGT